MISTEVFTQFYCVQHLNYNHLRKWNKIKSSKVCAHYSMISTDRRIYFYLELSIPSSFALEAANENKYPQDKYYFCIFRDKEEKGRRLKSEARPGHPFNLWSLWSMAFSVHTKKQTMCTIRDRKPQFQVINRFYSSKCIDLWSGSCTTIKNPFRSIPSPNFIFHSNVDLSLKGSPTPSPILLFFCSLLHNPWIQSQQSPHFMMVHTVLLFTWRNGWKKYASFTFKFIKCRWFSSSFSLSALPLLLLFIGSVCISPKEHLKTNDD